MGASRSNGVTFTARSQLLRRGCRLLVLTALNRAKWLRTSCERNPKSPCGAGVALWARLWPWTRRVYSSRGNKGLSVNASLRIRPGAGSLRCFHRWWNPQSSCPLAMRLGPPLCQGVTWS